MGNELISAFKCCTVSTNICDCERLRCPYFIPMGVRRGCMLNKDTDYDGLQNAPYDKRRIMREMWKAVEQLYAENSNLKANIKQQQVELQQAEKTTKKNGYWIRTGNYVTTAYGSLECMECSNCGAEVTIDEYDSFCPNCGVEMFG